ncbi:unnamed protein product [Darwinula stevensoni]|uniref:Uncharacterized protein n=1 Tax=Darwinula stevensoni TaxID=69355 RepID=A0A7R8XA16_9CRUS|nr:unnamed protein product [Darwinula stevensoni]CAG0891633.1 unnamed protein product [Darwinula stevensoni]
MGRSEEFLVPSSAMERPKPGLEGMHNVEGMPPTSEQYPRQALPFSRNTGDGESAPEQPEVNLRSDYKKREEKLTEKITSLEKRLEDMSKTLAEEKGLKRKQEAKSKELRNELEKERSARKNVERIKENIEKELDKTKVQMSNELESKQNDYWKLLVWHGVLWLLVLFNGITNGSEMAFPSTCDLGINIGAIFWIVFGLTKHLFLHMFLVAL